MVSARGVLRHEGFPYALDNGAWTAFQRREPFDVAAFERAVGVLGAGADFVVLPDIVAGGRASLDFSMSWIERLRGIAPLLLAVQDGMSETDIRSLISHEIGVFVGGSTEWKCSTVMQWGALCRERGAYLHVGRVNSAKRISLCISAGADSCDGSSATRFSVHAEPLAAAARQMDLFI